MCISRRYINSTTGTSSYLLIPTCMPGETESYHRWFRSSLCLHDIFHTLINSPVCWFCMSALGLVLFQIVTYCSSKNDVCMWYACTKYFPDVWQALKARLRCTCCVGRRSAAQIWWSWGTCLSRMGPALMLLTTWAKLLCSGPVRVRTTSWSTSSVMLAATSTSMTTMETRPSRSVHEWITLTEWKCVCACVRALCVFMCRCVWSVLWGGEGYFAVTT